MKEEKIEALFCRWQVSKCYDSFQPSSLFKVLLSFSISIDSIIQCLIMLSTLETPFVSSLWIQCIMFDDSFVRADLWTWLWLISA